MRRPLHLICICFVVFACKNEPDASTTAKQGAPAAEAEAEAADQPDELPAAEALLDKAVEAVGGRERLDRVESFHYVAAVELPGLNVTGDVEIWWKKGDFYAEQKIVGIGEIKEGKQGDLIWSQDPINGLRTLQGVEAEQHIWAASLMLPADWKRYFSEAETLGERTVDGRKVYDVELRTKSGAKMKMTFDAESGLQVGQSYEQVTPLGNAPVEAEIKDYREIEGLKIPHEQVTGTSLAKGVQRAKVVEINVEVDSAKFAMPTGGAEVVTGKGAKEPTMMPFGPDGKPGKPVPAKPQ